MSRAAFVHLRIDLESCDDEACSTPRAFLIRQLRIVLELLEAGQIKGDGSADQSLRDMNGNRCGYLRCVIEPEDEGDDLCDRCGRSGVTVDRTDEDGNTVCTACTDDEREG